MLLNTKVIFLFLLKDLSLRSELREKPCIRFMQENSMEFQVQSVYLIYTWLLVYTTLNLAYF